MVAQSVDPALSARDIIPAPKPASPPARGWSETLAEACLFQGPDHARRRRPRIRTRNSQDPARNALVVEELAGALPYPQMWPLVLAMLLGVAAALLMMLYLQH